ncbi:MAG: TonB-dependent receptor [Rhizobacter sp.]|nr:TonB-dependent receptor [Rhizobacter sp.]
MMLAAKAASAQSVAPSTGPASPASSPGSGQPAELAPIVVKGNYDNAVGTSDAASQGTVTSRLIEARPLLRPAEVLEFVPGVIVTQHSGDGKANQYFLRGFNLDHGTDFATFVDGMPVNMPTHAHGQGYSDLNWLIPELVDSVRYKKGPYFADEGDFASAGAAHIDLFAGLPRGVASITLGEHGYARALLADTVALEEGKLTYAIETSHNDGPWDLPENFRKFNGLLRYSVGNAADRTTITAMAYSARWNSTDQIPERAVNEGLIDRFGAVDDTDGGRTQRTSLSVQTQRTSSDGVFKANAYAIQSRLNLFSDFTYFLNDPVNGDQFEQAEKRQVFGGGASRSFNADWGGRDVVNTLGLQIRHDRLSPVGLYATSARERIATVQESQVRETSVGLYGESSVQWTPWLRSVAGLRWDHFNFDVYSSVAGNSGKADASITSPKLSFIFGPWASTEFFANYGWGYHSNDARGVTATVAPGTLLATQSVTPLVRSRGGEIGARTELVPGLQSSLSLWYLTLGSELVFSGDAGDTEPNRASRRYGVEWNNHYVARSWLLFDADLAASHARFTQSDPVGDYIPGAIDTVASLGVTVTDLGPWFGQFQLRYFGPRPLIEDDSQRSKSTTLASARVGYKLTKDLRVALDVFNLFDRKASDIDYFYTSRLPGEPAAGVDDTHFHPVEPRSVRLTLTMNF